MLGFYVPQTAKVIRSRGLGLKSHPKDWRNPGSNSRPLVYKASSLTTTPWRLLRISVVWEYVCVINGHTAEYVDLTVSDSIRLVLGDSPYDSKLHTLTTDIYDPSLLHNLTVLLVQSHVFPLSTGY